jgi:hypothetical protein
MVGKPEATHMSEKSPLLMLTHSSLQKASNGETDVYRQVDAGSCEILDATRCRRSPVFLGYVEHALAGSDPKLIL